MSNNLNPILVGKRYSFYQLLEEKQYSIEIPIIQRDYAQGRKSKSEVRDLFLQALFDYLEENIPNRDLDFVYGTTELQNKLEKFIPLDGQQRLTTLFLLHWYLANISENIEVFKNVIFKNGKSNFTYLTRTSSSEFCDALLQNDILVSDLLESDKNQNNSLSKTIKDKGWYFLSWSNDPTIQSMLRMLDSIHEKFASKPHYFSRLINTENPIITFLYLDLGDFNLTEDLYIKMNSRGKPLTPFENFKAKLEQHIKSLYTEDDKCFTLTFEGKEIGVSATEYFSFNIDTKWANLFWQYRKLAGKDNTFDEELMNFIRVIVSNQFAIENETNVSDFRLLTTKESGIFEDSEYISYNRLKNLNALTKESIKFLIKAFDSLTNGEDKIHLYLKDNFYYNESDIFEKVLTHRLTYPERVLFHAYVKFLIVNENDITNIDQWMRVMHNLTENSRFDDADAAISAIHSIENLLPYSKNILEYLVTKSNKIDFFYERQTQEEKLKAHLILKSKEWKESIENFEKLLFYKGQLGFIFDFSGILNYYETQNNCEWSVSEDKAFYKEFIYYANNATATFGILETDANKDFLLERAILSKGNYLIPASSDRLNICSSKSVSNYQRDYSWKRLLRINPEYEENYWKNKRILVKQLLDDKKLDVSNIKDSLINICKDIPDDWRKYLIENPEIIRYCRQGFIKILNETDVELYSASQLNHYHVNMHIYSYYIKYIKNNELQEYEPFVDVGYEGIKTADDFSNVYFENWCYRKKYYSLKLYRIDGKFCCEFKKAKGNIDQSEYSKEIIDILNDKKFKWNEDEKAFYLNRSTESSTNDFVKKLCLELKHLSGG